MMDAELASEVLEGTWQDHWPRNIFEFFNCEWCSTYVSEHTWKL